MSEDKQPPTVVVNNNIVNAAPAPVYPVYVGGCNHAVHALLTLFTCGAWLPVWLICALVDGSGGAVTPYDPNAAQVRRQPSSPPAVVSVIAVLVGLLLIVLGSSHSYPGMIVCGVLLAVGGAGYWFWRREVDRRGEQDRIAARADAEYQASLQGNPAGMYGRYPPAPLPERRYL